MTHDPICHFGKPCRRNDGEHYFPRGEEDGCLGCGNLCECDLISEARKDQKKKNQYEIDKAYAVGYMRGRTDAITEVKWENAR